MSEINEEQNLHLGQFGQPDAVGRCDVIVVGGGLAALSAAISAADTGCSVVLVNKGVTGESGSSAKAAGILAAPFGHGDLSHRPMADSAEQHAVDTLRVGYDLGDPDLVRHVTRNATSAVQWLEDMGIAFSRAEDGGYVQLNAPGNSCPRAVSALGGGNAVIKALIAKARDRGVAILDETTARQLLIDDDGVCGAVLHGRRPFIIEAPCVVLAAGGATGIFPSVSGDSGNVGSSLMLGYDAGAVLGNLEFIEFTLIYRVRGQILRIAGLAPFLSRGGKLFNRDGDDLFARHFPDVPPAQVGRAEILRMVERDIIAGRGPVMLDCRHFSEETWAEFERSQGSTTLEKIAAAGCDYRRERIEVIPAAHSVLAGLVIDCNAETTVAGLYAAGENATGVHGAGRLSGNGLTACAVLGLTAGANAGIRAVSLGNGGGNDDPGLDKLRRAVVALEDEPADPPPAYLESLVEQVRSLVGQNLGIVRNDADLQQTMRELASLQEQVDERDLRRKDVFEARQMMRLARLMAEAAFKRKESRGVQFKSDHQGMETSWARSQLFLKD